MPFSYPIDTYQIGIICALPNELRAVRAVLDEEHESLKSRPVEDHNSYILGRLGTHNVVLASPPASIVGRSSAALVGMHARRTFPQIRFGLFVGIGGGIPTPVNDIRLGDVVVGRPNGIYEGVVQYSMDRSTKQFQRQNVLSLPPTILLAALSRASSDALLEETFMVRHMDEVSRMYPHLRDMGFHHQGVENDQLYCGNCESSWLPYLSLSNCKECHNGKVHRQPRLNTTPMVHQGTIVSGDMIVKDTTARNQLREDFGALCIEMEAAGMMEDFPCLVIRGIADYADKHKSDMWRNYAALTAAVFAKVLLEYCSPSAVNETELIGEIIDQPYHSTKPPEGHNADREAYQQRQKQYRACHRGFATSDYESSKNINRNAMPGTCRWVLGHLKYKIWCTSPAVELLWILADPGCGKSVLAKSLTDVFFREDSDTESSIICYFFFRDNVKEDNLATALCAIIHQLFSQQPELLDHALASFVLHGDQLQGDVHELWRIFHSATNDPKARPTICVLDGLDECRNVDRELLVDLLCRPLLRRTSDSAQRKSSKWLVTSRPFHTVQGLLAQTSPTAYSIRLRGEDENDVFRDEIDVVIQEEMKRLSNECRLTPQLSQEITKRLLATENRTYLWLHLAITEIRASWQGVTRPRDQMVPFIPQSVEVAYEAILARTSGGQEKIVVAFLTILVGARRPLTIGEMAIAIEFAMSPKFVTVMTDVTGEFDSGYILELLAPLVRTVNGRLYLSHRTAEEFLLNHDDLEVTSNSWGHRLRLLETERMMTRVCVSFLSLSEFNDVWPRHMATVTNVVRSSVQTLLEYAAEHWADHARSIESHLKDDVWQVIDGLYDATSLRYGSWTAVMWKATVYRNQDFDLDDVHLAAFNGHDRMLQQILDKTRSKLDCRTHAGRSALSWATDRGNFTTVQVLLAQGADPNAQDGSYDTVLRIASERGHQGIARLLLATGADPNAQGGLYGTALQAASERGHQEIVRLLLATGADPNAQGGLYGTALQAASRRGHLDIVQVLLAQGANVNTQGGRHGSALKIALERGHEQVVQVLLDHDARVRDSSVLREGYVDDDSDPSEISSIQSLPSMTSNSTMISQNDNIGFEAAQQLVTIFYDDKTLLTAYEVANEQFDSSIFQRNHDQLLKIFFEDLRLESRDFSSLAMVRVLRRRERRSEITMLLQHIFQRSPPAQLEAMARLKEQEPDRKQLIAKLLHGQDMDRPQGAELGDKKVSLTTSDNPMDAESDSSSHEDSSSDEDTDDQHSTEVYDAVGGLERFIRTSRAFSQFKMNLRHLLIPPNNVAEALASRNLYIIQRFLTQNFTSVATGPYEWLHELDAAGYSKREISKLLLEDARDSPWVYFSPQEVATYTLKDDLHIPNCAHAANDDAKFLSSVAPGLFPPDFSHQRASVRRKVEELCGIAGILPISRDASKWYGSVTFTHDYTTSQVTYAKTSSDEKQSRQQSWRQLSDILANFVLAAATVQSAGFCCDAFSALVHSPDYLELRRVEFRQVKTMHEILSGLAKDSTNIDIAQDCARCAVQILQGLVTLSETATSNEKLHICALAIQFLCLGFVSYMQAHVGAIRPFFLDTPQHKLELFGNQETTGRSSIEVKLVKLTCLDEMIQDRVLAFSPTMANQTSNIVAETLRYNVLATAEDLLDTWGPGYLIRDGSLNMNYTAIAIGGGTISASEGNPSIFHWSRTAIDQESRTCFRPTTKIVIGAIISVNQNCDMDGITSRNSSICALEHLGTYGPFWYVKQRQAGVGGGQYLNGNFIQVWDKIPGKTLKDYSLEQSERNVVTILDQNWGLQVSFCTSVARRVPIRQLIADLLPEFVNPMDRDTWHELTSVHNIIDVFTHHDIHAWLNHLPDSLRSDVLAMVYQILWQLRHTGLDPQTSTLKVAWPRNNDLRGLRIPCVSQTCWASILADAEDCATFAYITTKCLETSLVKCQGVSRAWQNVSKMLVTEVSQHRSGGFPVATTSAGGVSNSNAMVAVSTVTGQWRLNNQETYYMKKFDSLIWVRVERSVATDNDVPHLVIAESTIPRKLWARVLMREEKKRNNCIREKQMLGDHAESVVVRSSLSRLR